MQCYSWGGAMGLWTIQQENGPLTTEIAILNLERRAHWNFKFICNKWKMAHIMVCPAITLVMDHFSNNNILVHFQHGFRLKRSTETQLILMASDLAKNLDENKQMDMLILDFNKTCCY